MERITLYQFALCPFCHKVRAGLEAKGLSYDVVEVNPMNKRELPELPEGAPRKVPVLTHGDRTVFDSTDILNFLEETYPDRAPFRLADAKAQAHTEAVEAWVDDSFTQALPTVIYGTWGEAFTAAQVTARTSNFGFVQNLSVRAGGSLIMHQVAKRILKKNGKSDGHAWVAENLDQFEAWLGDQDFVAGASLSLGDVAMHGAITCVEPFPVFREIMARPRVKAWFERVDALRHKKTRRAAARTPSTAHAAPVAS